MYFLSASVAALLAATASSHPFKPFKFPLKDGFPNPSPAQISQIQQKAGGSLPNGPLPSSLKPAGVTALSLIAHNEIFEVAFFSSLIANITSNAHGYNKHSDFAPFTREQVLEALTATVNQEELHAAGVNAALKNANAKPIVPCEYVFPGATSYLSAITLANTFTDLVLSTLPFAQAGFAKDGGDEAGLVPLFGSVIGQEGEQNGFYRISQRKGKTPSAAPFLTGGDPNFPFNALQQFIVPGSCKETPITDLPLKKFGSLELVGKPPGNKDQNVEFAVPKDSKVAEGEYSIVYLSGQNLPVVESITKPEEKNGVKVFEAKFPFASKSFANGLTIAALVKGKGPFKSGAEVAAVTVNGPGLIEVN